ncbi:MAG TPA: STAS domain-containing protein [Bacteroidota bacterium]|nr:STAS domain-containing protein [Bacteroidota bacterium]
MKLTTHDIGAVSVLTLDGTMLGGPDAAEINNTLHKMIDAKKKKVVIDLGAVSLMNSSGLGILIGGVTTMRNAGGDLKLAAVSPKVMNLLTITKLMNVFEVYDTVKKAVASY